MGRPSAVSCSHPEQIVADLRIPEHLIHSISSTIPNGTKNWMASGRNPWMFPSESVVAFDRNHWMTSRNSQALTLLGLMAANDFMLIFSAS